MQTCSVEGCQRPATGAHLKTEDRTYSLCTRHAEILVERIISVAKDDDELARARSTGAGRRTG